MKLQKLSLFAMLVTSALFCSILVGEPVKSALQLELVPGSAYSHWHLFGIFPKKLTPQMAAWVEDEEGQLISLLFLSSRSAEKSWVGGTDRPEALSLFNGRHSAADTVSSATPGRSDAVSMTPGETAVFDTTDLYTVFFEVNVSFDYNQKWPKESSGVNGQPSLVYSAVFPGDFRGVVNLRPSGTGGLNGPVEHLIPELSGLTSALQIVEKVSLNIDSYPEGYTGE